MAELFDAQMLKRSEFISALTAAGFLLLAAWSHWAYAFYILLRVGVFAIGLYLAHRSSVVNRTPWVWLFGAIAFIFNPIFPMRMHRSDWSILNMIAAAIFVAWVVASILQNRDPVTRSAQSLLATDYDRKCFTEFLRTHRGFASKLQGNSSLIHPDDPWTKWTLGLLFSNYGAALGDAGDLRGASEAFAFSMDFFDPNPPAWVGLAELNVAKQDQIAARYARKVLDFAPMASSSELIQRVFTDNEMLCALTEMKARMRSIVQTCSKHSEWKDSYPIHRTHRPFHDPL